MANRAYLFFCDDVSALTYSSHYQKSDGSDREYMDSRHAFPLAWWLFFDSESVHLISQEQQTYDDIYLARDWESAQADFARRLPLLRAWFPALSERDVETFLNWLQSLQETPGERFLVADPSEVEIEDTHQTEVANWLITLHDESLNAQQKWALIPHWSRWEPTDDLDKLRNRNFGYFYGEPAPGYFRHCLSWPNQSGG